MNQQQHLKGLATRVTGLVACVAFALAAAGCASSDQDKNAARTDVPKPLPSNTFARQWVNAIDLDKGDALAELFLREDTLFAYTKNKLVYAVGASGDLKYLAQPEVSGGVLRPPLVLGERVLYPSGSTLEIFNNRGRRVRTIEFEKPTRSSAIGVGNTVYLGLDHTGGTGTLASLDITKAYRVINWELMTRGAVTPAPAYFDRTIYAGSEDGSIYAVNEVRSGVWSLPDGSPTFNTQGRFVSDIKVDDFGVYASNTDSKLYCLDRVTGRLKWTFYGGGSPLKTAPVVMSTLVYQYVPDSGIVAIEKTTGQYNRAAKWQVKNAIEFLSEDQGHAYLRRKDNRIIAVDKQTGQALFLSGRHPLSVFAANNKDSTIYGASKDGQVWSIRPVLREGEVGTIVMDFRVEPLALR